MGLGLTTGDLITAIEDYMGWAAADDHDATAISWINEGYRRFRRGSYIDYDKTRKHHAWSFLKPEAELVLWTDVTGTVSGSPSYAGGTGLSTITATAASFYASMIGQSFTFDTSETEYVVAGYTSSTVITVTGDASGEASDDTFTMTATGIYALPAGFGGMVENPVWVYDGYDNNDIIEVAGTLLDTNLRDDPNAGTTAMWCKQPRNVSPGTSDQTWDIKVWRIPEYTRTVRYRYRRVIADLSESAKTDYPVGGADHCDTIRAWAMAAAEAHTHKTDGAMENHAMELMRESVELDVTEFDSTGFPDQIEI